MATGKTVLVLKTVQSDMHTRGTDSRGKPWDFVWPVNGPVEATDYEPTKECGHGLHGWLWGAGDWSLKKGGDIKWLVIEVAQDEELVDLGGKVKFRRGNVLGTFGHWREAMAVIRARLKQDAQGVLQSLATKDGELASATGYYGHASATGYSGHASATGCYGHASATGCSGHASATGDYGHASATGGSGWAVVGREGRAKANKSGTLTILWWDGKRKRVAVGYVGEDGIKADTWYQVRDGKLVEC